MVLSEHVLLFVVIRSEQFLRARKPSKFTFL